jgi:hypothetical protein
LEKIYPIKEPKKAETITPEKTKIKLFIKGFFNKLIDSIIFSIVGSIGGVIGVVKITSWELFKAVTIQVHNGSRLAITNMINKPYSNILDGLMFNIFISPYKF